MRDREHFDRVGRQSVQHDERERAEHDAAGARVVGASAERPFGDLVERRIDLLREARGDLVAALRPVPADRASESASASSRTRTVRFSSGKRISSELALSRGPQSQPGVIERHPVCGARVDLRDASRQLRVPRAAPLLVGQ